MMIQVLKSKIHCVTVTEANLNYMGSITVDEDLLDAANMIAGEKVQIVDNNNGERFETYIIKGERGSGCICLNGAESASRGRGYHYVVCLDGFRRSQTIQAFGYFP